MYAGCHHSRELHSRTCKSELRKTISTRDKFPDWLPLLAREQPRPARQRSRCGELIVSDLTRPGYQWILTAGLFSVRGPSPTTQSRGTCISQELTSCYQYFIDAKNHSARGKVGIWACARSLLFVEAVPPPHLHNPQRG